MLWRKSWLRQERCFEKSFSLVRQSGHRQLTTMLPAHRDLQKREVWIVAKWTTGLKCYKLSCSLVKDRKREIFFPPCRGAATSTREVEEE